MHLDSHKLHPIPQFIKQITITQKTAGHEHADAHTVQHSIIKVKQQINLPGDRKCNQKDGAHLGERIRILLEPPSSENFSVNP